MEKMELLAYAKINLTLDVTERLPNGYHRIDSFMQTVSLADKLTVEIKQGSGIEVGCRSSYAPNGKDNIVYRAVQRYLQETRHSANVKITLEKTFRRPGDLEEAVPMRPRCFALWPIISGRHRIARP